MLSAWIFLMLNSLFVTLRLSGGGGGSFPRPLKAEEEREYLTRFAQGDMEARNLLIEHNLRLVAHIMKKGESERQFFLKSEWTSRFQGLREGSVIPLLRDVGNKSPLIILCEMHKLFLKSFHF